MRFVRFFEYYLTFQQISWLKYLCSGLSHCFIVVNFNICSRSSHLEFEKVISKETHLEKIPLAFPVTICIVDQAFHRVSTWHFSTVFSDIYVL